MRIWTHNSCTANTPRMKSLSNAERGSPETSETNGLKALIVKLRLITPSCKLQTVCSAIIVENFLECFTGKVSARCLYRASRIDPLLPQTGVNVRNCPSIFLSTQGLLWPGFRIKVSFFLKGQISWSKKIQRKILATWTWLWNLEKQNKTNQNA